MLSPPSAVLGFRARWLALVNFVVALLMLALSAWLSMQAEAAAEDAVRRYGHNVDSGALLAAFATYDLLPAAALFAIAGIARWRGWRLRWSLQALPLLWIALPLLTVHFPHL